MARRSGVGLVLESRGGGPSLVAGLAPGGTAEECGQIRFGDCIEKVDGHPVRGLTPTELSQIIAGPEGTWVALGFRRIVSNFFSESEETFEV
eukprot:CAMPEP_0180391058 /NCGR_PEP_ID=MMETSP0989-20121125/32367_1 /TAXON_ID=697907 /ORGANISM="non described non described, Strain CCMP2293" /LENGTH=91 /DNA_ID=CAMNT_0022392557 /DNA_START=11 /DNA_END=282 /DNA_ORIENTATION=-